MTVKELIEQLQKFPDNAIVISFDAGCGCCSNGWEHYKGLYKSNERLLRETIYYTKKNLYIPPNLDIVLL